MALPREIEATSIRGCGVRGVGKNGVKSPSPCQIDNDETSTNWLERQIQQDGVHNVTYELSGRCQCDAVECVVPDAFSYAANCHCSDCRCMTGAAFKTFAGIERQRFRIVKGVGAVKKIGDGICYDIRCDICGSFLVSVVRDGSFVHVNMGTLTDTPTIRPSCHIFTRSKAPWFDITDDLPQFDGHSP